MRWTLKDARPYIAGIPNLNLCPDDPRVDDIINRAQEYVVIHSRGEVLHQRIAVCVTNNCIVWPRQVASITDASICSQPIPLRNQWYEFLPDGVGTYVGQQTCDLSAHDRGDVCAFDEIIATVPTVTPKENARAATTANITLSGEQTIDAVAVVAGDRVLVKDQTSASENGIYVAAAGAWSRAADEVANGIYALVTDGTVNGLKYFVLSTPNPITLGTTGLTFVEFTPGQLTKKLKVYLDMEEDAGKYLYAYGLNHNGIWIRTDIDGEIRDGERIPLVTGQLSMNLFQALQRTRKDETKGRVLVFEHDTITGLERPLAIYEPDETNPVYRKTLLRGTGGCPGGCGKSTVVAMAKLEFIPAKNDDDVLLVQSRTALRFIVMALLKFDNNRENEGQALANLGMAEMGFYRDHKSPKEQISIRLRTQGTARMSRRRIGRML